MKRVYILLAFTAVSIQLIGKENSAFVRYPSLNPDGTHLAFSYQGDIWTVPLNGGKATRITLHQAYESNPVWSPDGNRIAFSSNRFGQDDIFLMPSEGGIPRRITHHSASDILCDWTESGDLIFESDRNFRQVERGYELMTVPCSGGTPVRLLDALGSRPTVSPDGRLVALVLGDCRISREQYHGSANRDIWIYDTELKTFEQLTDFQGQDYHPVWGNRNQLYFLSARSGKYNIYYLELDDAGKKKAGPRQITHEDTDQVRYFDVCARNGTIVYEKDINFYVVSTSGGESQKIHIDIAADYRFDPYENKTYTGDIDEYEISPGGEYSAFVIHGEVFISENDKDKNLTRNLSNSPYREKDISWLNDSSLIFSSDRTGQFDLFLVQSSDATQTDLFRTLKYEVKRLTRSETDERSAVVSPDGEKIAFVRGGNFGKMEYVVASIDQNGLISNEIILLKGWNAPSGVQWSPDSKWLAYSLSDLYFNSEIYIHSVSGQQAAVNVSMHPRGDRSPVWSPDGSKLGFISARNNQDDDIWFVWLKKEDSQKTESDWEEEDDEVGYERTPKKDKKAKDKAETEDKKMDEVKVEIDFENIHERLVQVTSLSGYERNLAISKDGKTFYFSATSPGKTGQDLFSIQWDGKDMKAVTSGGMGPGDIKLDAPMKYIYMNIQGKISRIGTGGKELENLPVNAKLKIDYNVEQEQVFEEAWRALRDGFYDPDFHGRDWNALKSQFKPYCMAASTRKDFMDMFNIMLGQLNASHMGLRVKDREQTQSEKTGLLGIDIVPLPQGVQVRRVIPDTPADKISSKLNSGDIIEAVNGQPVRQEENFWALLTNTANEKVLLEVKNSAGEQREVVIRPFSSLRDELYNEWVKERRRLTDEYSGGKLGYLHIRGMDIPSFERFERELTAAGHGKQAIVIDVRFNGGGSTTDYLMAILNVKQHAYTIPRGAEESLANHKDYRQYYPFAERLPFFAWNKPSIALCNEASYSNAEIFSHAYKNLGIGKLVGTPTFGAVISTSAVMLMDGSSVRMPFRGWYVKATDINMDKEPATPDIIVVNSPDGKARGVDEQLQKACETLLVQIRDQASQ